MTNCTTLENHLASWAGAHGQRNAIGRTVIAIAEAGGIIADLLALGPLAGDLSAARGTNLGGDAQKELDIRSNDIVIDRLRRAPVALVGSEESDAAVALDPTGSLVVAIDPLDGSSNIDANVSVGTLFTIFSIRSNDRADAIGAEAALLQPGNRQLAAGFLIYGPQTALVLTLGAGTDIFVLNRGTGRFVLARAAVSIPLGTAEYAINASNYRHWDPPIRSYVDDCLAGGEGPRGKEFNMRWIASLVADAFRILSRGGIYLYPSDARKGYRSGRLRLVYEANPVAFLVEQAGGAATDGHRRILDLQPTHLHERTPLVFGSRDKVERVARHHLEPDSMADRAPLFARRGLLRV